MKDLRYWTVNFRLENGATLRELELAYVTHGKLAPDGRNAVLLTHGYTSNHFIVDSEAGPRTGEWGTLVGPGAPIDTDRFFVVASNMLGSSYGSTGPASVNPETNRPYGPAFPDISLADMVAAQRAMLDALGVKRLVAVAGASYGGFQAFQWAASYPDFVSGVVAACTSPKSPRPASSLDELLAYLAQDPNWNGGDYYARGGVLPTLTRLRIDTLKLYGIDQQLAADFPDPAARETEIRRQAEEWSRVFDANSLVVLRRASNRFDITDRLDRLRARILYVLSRTDRIFPPRFATEFMPMFKAAGLEAEYLELDTELGHSCGPEVAPQWAPTLAAFMRNLAS
jgi:homoserine O-acetyltransferase